MHDAEQQLAEDVWRRARGRHLLLLLDFDGTLCEFQADPNAVVLPESRRFILQKLLARTTVGIVSGRRLEDVRRRCALDGAIVAGLHGLEIEAFGERFVHPELQGAAAVIAEVADRLRETTPKLPGVFVEDKHASMALHFREADAAAQRLALDAFAATASPAVERGNARVMRGSYVLELLPNVDWNKGSAVRWITERVQQREGETFVVYIGDDVTDQDAFSAVEAEGLPIAASDRVTARATLDGPVGVERFLSAL
jgi:trehalose-phosphatase